MAFSWGSETPEPCKGRAKPEESVTEAEKEVPVKRRGAVWMHCPTLLPLCKRFSRC